MKQEENKPNKEWYKTKQGAIIAFLILPIFSIWYVWKKTNYDREKKFIITGILIFVFSVFYLVGSTTFENQAVSTNTQNQQGEKAPDYEVVEEWIIPNGGYGKRIVISPNNVNEKDLTLLGEKLKKDNKYDRNTFVMVHTDKKSAEIQRNLSKATEEEKAYLDKHYVAQYSKNGNTGYHEFLMYLNGLMGESKTIKY